MKRSALIPLALAVPVLASCASTPEPRGHELTRHTWQLVEITRPGWQPVKLTSEQAGRHRATFSADGRVSFKLDCNVGNADWSAEAPRDGSGSLFIGPIAATRALCPTPSYGETMASDLPLAQGFTIARKGRSITIATRNGVYAFDAADR